MGSKKKSKELPPQQNPGPSAESSNAAPVKTEGPVLAALSRRLRAVRKKLNRVEELEEGLANGKQPHPDQEGLLKSKPGLLSAIDELEKLFSVMKDAVKEELDAQKEQLQEDFQEEIEAVKADLSATTTALEEANTATLAAQAEAEEARAAAAQPVPEPEPPAPAVDVESERAAAVSDGVKRLLQLLYFSQIFDEAGPWSTAIERKACVTYDYAARLEGEPLSDADLVVVSRFGKSLITRPAGKLIDHKSMVQHNSELAIKFLKQEPEVLPELGCSVERVNERLQRVLASEYYTIQPKVHEVPYEEEHPAAAAAAAAAGAPPAQPPAPPAQPEGSMPFPHEPHAHNIQQLPPMPNIPASAAPGNAMLDDPAIAMSQLSRPGASIPPPPASVPKQVPAGVQPPPHTGQQIHHSQMPPVLQQLLGQQPPAYPNYLPQQHVPMPGFGVAPAQFGIQDPTVYSFGSLAGIELATSTPMEAPLPSSAPPPTTSPALPAAEPQPSNLSHGPPTPPPAPSLPAFSMPPPIPDMQPLPVHGLPPGVGMMPNGGFSLARPQGPPPAHGDGSQGPPPSLAPANPYSAPPYPPRGEGRGYERGRGRGRGGRAGGGGPTSDGGGRGNRAVEREGEQRGDRQRGGEGRGGGFRGRGGRGGGRGRGEQGSGGQGMPGPQVMYPPHPGPPMMIPPQAQFGMQ